MNFHYQENRFSVVGLSTKADNWCNVGAYTRIAKYSDWVYKSIEYFEGRPLLQPRQQLNVPASDDDEEGKYFEMSKNGYIQNLYKHCLVE